MSHRVLTTRELNRALLARQLLLERSDLTIEAAVERVAGLQTQYAPSAYIGLWSRLSDLRRAALTEALEARRVVQATLMRATIHIVSARDYALFTAAVRRSRRDWWVRVQHKALAGIDMGPVVALVRQHLADGPRRATELKKRLQAEGYPPIAWSSVGMWLDLVRVPPSGTWEKRRADLYGLADVWLGPSGATEDDGLEHLARRYLAGFGPASLRDLQSWSGVPAATLGSVVERLDLRRFVDEEGVELLDVPDGPLPNPKTPAPVRFLPTWDATLLVHARRTQILPEAYRQRVFNTKTPHSTPTFLVDGAVAGAWRYERGAVRLDPFRPLASSERRQLEGEAEQLSQLHR